ERVVAFALFAARCAEILPPLARRVDCLAAVPGDALADRGQHGRIDRHARDYHLAFGQRGQFVQQPPSRAFAGRSDGLLIYGVDDAHDELSHALRQHVLIEFARALRDQADADAEFAAL